MADGSNGGIEGYGSLTLNRQILRLSVPSVIAALSVPLVGIVDTALVGHLSEVAYMGAVAVASVIFDVIYWGCGFLRMGTTALTAHYYGAGSRRSCVEVLYQAGAMAIGIGAALILGRELIGDVGFRLAGGSPDVDLWGRRYFAVRILGAPLVLLTYALTGFFRGIADAITPMWMTILVNVVNVFGDYALIYGKFGAPELGVLGAAWASVLAVLAGLVFGVGRLLWRYRAYLSERPAGIFDRQKLRRLVSTNANLFGRTACLLFAQFTMLGVVARMGEAALAANAVLWQIWSLVSYSVDGFAHAAETLVGNDLGARAFSEVRRVARRCLVWGTGLGVGYTLAYWAGMDWIARGFTDHGEVARLVVSLTLWIAAIQPLNGAVFIFDGIFIGANDTGYLFRAMALAAFGVYLPALLLFVYGLNLGLAGAWMGYNCLMVGRFATLLYRYKGDRWIQTFVGGGR